MGRGGDASGTAEITVLFRDFTAEYGKNYTASEHGGSEAAVPDGHMSYVEVLADADSYEEYPLLSEEDAEEYLLNSAEEVESYLTGGASGSVKSAALPADDGSEAEVTGVFSDNPLAKAHAASAGRSLNRIPAMDGTGSVMVNTETGETSGGESDASPEELTNDFTAEHTEKC